MCESGIFLGGFVCESGIFLVGFVGNLQDTKYKTNNTSFCRGLKTKQPLSSSSSSLGRTVAPDA
jgi:hypothetical protein